MNHIAFVVLFHGVVGIDTDQHDVYHVGRQVRVDLQLAQIDGVRVDILVHSSQGRIIQVGEIKISVRTVIFACFFVLFVLFFVEKEFFFYFFSAEIILFEFSKGENRENQAQDQQQGNNTFHGNLQVQCTMHHICREKITAGAR